MQIFLVFFSVIPAILFCKSTIIPRISNVSFSIIPLNSFRDHMQLAEAPPNPSPNLPKSLLSVGFVLGLVGQYMLRRCYGTSDALRRSHKNCDFEQKV